VIPASFGTAAYFSNNAFVFVNKDGVKQAGRYQFLPLAARRDLSDDEAKALSPNFLSEELRRRLANGPVKFRLVVQLANAGDPTNDASLVWPDDRRTIEMGTISVTSVVADSDTAQKALVFFPTALTDGIELSDDPLPACERAPMRSRSHVASNNRRSAMIRLNVNGKPGDIDVAKDTPLLWALRDVLNMTGTKFGCGAGLCGACTIQIDGQPTRSCITPVSAAVGKRVTTIEAIGATPAGKKVQAAWLALNVPQCGYCQSGQIMSASALLAANAKPSDADIDSAMAGNICRCGTYPRIRAAIKKAAGVPETEA